jgi:hypothetical protein
MNVAKNRTPDCIDLPQGTAWFDDLRAELVQFPCGLTTIRSTAFLSF